MIPGRRHDGDVGLGDAVFYDALVGTEPHLVTVERDGLGLARCPAGVEDIGFPASEGLREVGWGVAENGVVRLSAGSAGITLADAKRGLKVALLNMASAASAFVSSKISASAPAVSAMFTSSSGFPWKGSWTVGELCLCPAIIASAAAGRFEVSTATGASPTRSASAFIS